ncbi:hypothetical protein Vi05172_g1809 [Venturia inaequalis]|nr:hypothetical protein Vi05172_g1809 [Venturia inaequalis]
MYLSLLTGLSLLATQTLAQVGGPCGSGTRSGRINWSSGGFCTRQGNIWHCPGGGWVELSAGKVALHSNGRDITVYVQCPGVNALFWCLQPHWETYNLRECDPNTKWAQVKLVNEH